MLPILERIHLLLPNALFPETFYAVYNYLYGVVAVYMLLSVITLHLFPDRIRLIAFSILNIIFVYIIFFFRDQNHGLFALYILSGAVFYFILRLFGRHAGRLSLIPILTPIAALIYYKIDSTLAILGFSYMSFRLSLTAFELSEGRIKMPSFPSFMGFTFFLPTFFLGPINPFSNWQNSLSIKQKRSCTFSFEIMNRLLIGLVKVVLVANLMNQFSFESLWVNHGIHTPLVLFIGLSCSFLYLYMNFSGYCDLIIAGSAALNIKVMENFRSPLVARNLNEFWQRWHISLGEYMKVMFFIPVSLWLTRLFRLTNPNHTIALTIFLTFILIGLWHGNGINFFYLGLAHAVGLVVVHYYALFLKAHGVGPGHWLRRGKAVKFFSTGLTFFYVIFASSFFFLDEKDYQAISMMWGQM